MKNLNINIASFIKRRGTALLIVGTLAVSSLTGCGKKADCEIPNRHAHMYVNDDGYVRYIESEKIEFDDYNRSYNYIDLTEEESQFYNILISKDMFRIDDNIDLILAQQEQNRSFMIYEYSYNTNSRVGSSTSYYWTNDPEHEDLTGKEKEVHYIYQAYNVKKDEDGKFIVYPSPIVEDIMEVMEEYPYIRENYYVAVDEYNVAVKFSDDLSKKAQDDKIYKKTVE